jgi:hypothetical protein
MRRLYPRQHARHTDRRRGAALVEFAILSPLFLTLTLGIIEGGEALETSNIMSSAVREGGRLASMDWEGMIPQGMTTNEKVIQDIRNFMSAAGLPADEVTIEITSAEDEDFGSPFDLSATSNRLRLFQITASVPYDSISTFPVNFMEGHTITAKLSLRAGRVNM